MSTLSATTTHKVVLTLQARSMLAFTKYGVKLHISRNKGNLAEFNLGKQLEKNGKMNSSIVFTSGLWQITEQTRTWMLLI